MPTNWFDTPKSSFIVKVGYDKGNEELHVIIDTEDGHLNGYTYYDVPVDVFDEFMNSSSKGAYYNTHISHVYEFST
jgi:hypothetical protein